MTKILAVDDERDILMLIANALKKENYEVDCKMSADEIDWETLHTYDLILLDIMMPGMDGITLCGKVRDQVDCPILFLTAKAMENDVENGFDAGADDYIKKPFSVVELRARIAAHLRRQNREVHSSYNRDGVCFYLNKKEVWYQDKQVAFTGSEYAICELLSKNHGQVYSREQIYDAISGFDGESEPAAITEHIKNIRRKFNDLGISPVETVWGIGYRWK